MRWRWPAASCRRPAALVAEVRRARRGQSAVPRAADARRRRARARGCRRRCTASCSRGWTGCPERDRAALRAAAVVGQRFPLALVRHLAQLPDYSCDVLVAHFLVRPEGDEFLFAHALIRDGVYASLTRARRAELHRAAADVVRRARSGAARRAPRPRRSTGGRARVSRRGARAGRRAAAGARAGARRARRRAGQGAGRRGGAQHAARPAALRVGRGPAGGRRLRDRAGGGAATRRALPRADRHRRRPAIDRRRGRGARRARRGRAARPRRRASRASCPSCITRAATCISRAATSRAAPPRTRRRWRARARSPTRRGRRAR